jgi:hypothetical protein
MKYGMFRKVLSLTVAAALVACGGSGTSTNTNEPPQAATPQTTVGQISGFGSVYVNGVEYETTGASYDVDDASASSDAALEVGMIVKIQGSVNPNGRTGQANSISYDDDIEGRVENLASDAGDPENVKTFTVLGVSVVADKRNTNFKGEDDPAFSFETIMNGDNVEISGEYSGDVLLASYIEKQDDADDEFEAKGTVDQFNGSDQFVLVLRNDSILNITIAAGAEIPSAGVMDGQYVEVEGTIPDPAVPDAILATKVELEDQDRIGDSDEDEAEIKGLLSYDVDTGTWSVLDVRLILDENTEYSPAELGTMIADLSADGLNVEVEGQYVEDALLVEKIELEEDDLEFKGDVEAVTSTDARDGTVTLSFGSAIGSVDVRVTPDTMFLDDDAIDRFDLGSIMMDDKVEIEARIADDGLFYASSIQVEDDTGYEIEGPMDAIDDASITVLGVKFTVDIDTLFVNGTPVAGNYVEVEDNDADGTADTVEIED